MRSCLRERGIETALHYPFSPARQEALVLFCRGDYPVTEMLQEHGLSLPLSFGAPESEIDAVIEAMNECARRAAG